MKNPLTLLIVLLATIGQAQNNFFYLDDVRWEINGVEYDEYGDDINTWHIGDVISKRDTIINNKEYKIIGWENTNKDYALRTDSVSKVWVIYLDRLIGYGTENDSIYIESDDSWIYRLSNDSTEYILYDYDGAEGDTIDIYIPPFTYSGNLPDTGGMFRFRRLEGSNEICVNNEYKDIIGFTCVEPVPDAMPEIYDAYFNCLGGIGAIIGGPIYTESTSYWQGPDVIISRVFQYGVQIYPCPVNIESNSIIAYPKVYPNPVSDFIQIKTQSIKPITITIYDIYGRIVFFEQNYLNNSKIVLTQLVDGIYFLVLLTENRRIEHKIIKQTI
jgi:hypothetical protein